jgi:hypothetical protein
VIQPGATAASVAVARCRLNWRPRSTPSTALHPLGRAHAQDASQQIAYAAPTPGHVFDGTVKSKSGKKVSPKSQLHGDRHLFRGGESYRGQVAVGQVVMNRVAHKLYPDTICAVVFQNKSKRNACQFSSPATASPSAFTTRRRGPGRRDR